MNKYFDFETCQDGYVVYQDGRRVAASDLVGMLNGNGQGDHQMPEWVQHFLVHFVKRSAKMLITWIDDARDANIINPKIVNRKDGDNRLKNLS